MTLLQMNAAYPRTVIQKWRDEHQAWRYSYLCEDITLGTASAYYRAAQDAMLAADLPRREAEREKGATRPRFYFIPDGREDPYGTDRYATSGGHSKALHLSCFWRAVQHEKDALAVAIYRPDDIAPAIVTNLQSHFVFPMPDEMWVNGRPVLPHETPDENVTTLILRYDTAMIAVRILWSLTQDGPPGPQASRLQAAENNTDYMRLTIHHCPTPFRRTAPIQNPGVAFHIRIGSAITDPDAWRAAFLETSPTAVITPDRIHLALQTETGVPLSLETLKRISFTANFPGYIPTRFTPDFPPGILRVNGEELGRPMLERNFPFIKKYAEEY